MALILMFINFNAKVVEQTKTTQNIVKSQNQILDAIKQLALDNKITSEQKANLIICMLQVPVAQRTTDTVENCRKQVEGQVTKPISSSPEKGSTASESQTTNTSSNAPKRSFISPVVDVVNSVLQKVGVKKTL